jgi:glyoxylase-like metal-dependent hydrolase (beta-lactamase superfamily II)
MPNYLCATCGVQYATSEQPPEGCRICQDERQYVGLNGQQWTTLETVQQNHHNTFTALQPGLTSIVTEPGFAIGQRAHLVQTPRYNLLWDCITLLDGATIAKIRSMGGLAALALSHPHYYSTIVEWSHAFGGIPVYIHATDQTWVTRPDPVIRFWEGDTYALADGLTLIRCGGHFDGSCVLHWRDGAGGQGVLLSGDSIYVVTDRRYVSFMYSFPNLIPLPASKVKHIVRSIEGLAFEQVYDAFGRIISQDGKAAVMRSAERYIKAITA